MVCVEGSCLALASGVCSAYIRQCWDNLCHGRHRRQEVRLTDDSFQDREDFEELISFLAAVPLFQKQLPKAELPKIASALQLKTWAPGDRVIEQGKDGKAFFIVRDGEASVVVKATDGEFVRATLYYGDYFGGHTLTQKRPNIATILAKGPGPLTTLSMSREEFERLGLHKELRFPKRPAIYDGRIVEDGQRMEGMETGLSLSGSVHDGQDLTEEEEAFVCKAIRENSNLRARVDVDPRTARGLTRAAQRKRVPRGCDILKGGEIASEFFVIFKGSFKLIPRVMASGDHQSVEAMVASSAATERLGRKQQFLATMVRTGASLPKAVRASGGSRSVASAKSGRSQSFRVPNMSQGNGLMRRHSQMVSSQSKKSPFKVGDTVARVVVGAGLTREVGRVDEVRIPGVKGKVVVEFPEPQGKQEVDVQKLRPAEDAKPIATLQGGDCCGELELLYNTRQMATSQALEDSVVFAIDQRTFKECFGRESPHFKDCCRLLNEVNILTSLLLTERHELARNSAGMLSFGPGERVLRQGDAAAQVMWYVVDKGSCKAVRETETADGEKASEEIGHYVRSDFFGEDLIMGSAAGRTKVPEFSIDAGPEGMTCAVFDGEVLKNLMGTGDGQNSDLFEFTGRTSTANLLSAVPFDMLQKKAILGEGGFGSVFLVKYEDKEYALKRMSKGYIVEAKVSKQIRAERDIFAMVDSDFIVRFFRSYQDEQYVYMLMEFASGGHLWGMMSDNWEVLQKDNPRGSATMFYIACVSFAFDHLHERRIVYRDLKPENILLDERGYAKICDLGFARFVLTKTNTLVGTPEYMAPEMIDTPHAHDRMVDWWALGVLTFELLTGQVPWDDQAAIETMAQILTIRKGQESGIPEQLLPSGSILVKDFIKKLLTVNEEQRMGRKRGGADVREHTWFVYAGFDFAALRAGTMRAPYQPPGKVIEKRLPDNSDDAKLDGSLFVPYTPDGTGWEAAF